MAFDLEAGAQLAQTMARATVELSVNNRGGGCGIVWDRDVIVTNAHVVGSARRARILRRPLLGTPPTCAWETSWLRSARRWASRVR